jgi:transketolase
VIKALDDSEKCKGLPTIIIAETIKGKGVSFMENCPKDFHGKAPSKEEVIKALEELI